MNNLNERSFCEGQKIYVIDSWCCLAVAAAAIITYVESDERWFIASIDGTSRKRYRFEDYGILVFESIKDAGKALTRIPNPKKTVYQIIGKRIYLKTVKWIDEADSYFQEILIVLDRGNPISIKEIGKTVFFNYQQAKSNVKK